MKRHRRPKLRSVLVPIDLSPSSDRILGRLALLPLEDDVRVTLLHVVPRYLPPKEEHRAERDAGKALAEEARHVRASLPEDARVATRVTVGDAAAEIAACPAKVDAELVVMGRGGGRVLRDAFLGSTAERVIRRAQLPALVVRLAPRTIYSRPALAVDVEHPVDEVLRLALLLLPPPRPPMAVFHAVDIPYSGVIYPSLSEEDLVEVKGGLELEVRAELASLMGKALAELELLPEHVPEWTPHVRVGSPRAVVAKSVRMMEADLLVLGTSGRSGLAHAFLGTVAGDLLRDVRCDVLVVPPRAKATSRARRRRGR